MRIFSTKLCYIASAVIFVSCGRKVKCVVVKYFGVICFDGWTVGRKVITRAHPEICSSESPFPERNYIYIYIYIYILFVVNKIKLQLL